MKKHWLALSLLIASCAVGLAGSDSYSGKEMKQVAPMPPPPCHNWTGFYIGAFGGYKFGVIDPSMSLGGDWATFPEDASSLESHANHNLDTDGAEVGGLIGYNYEVSNWVFGLEAAGGYLWLRNYHDEGEFFAVDQYFLWTSFKTHYLVTVGPRIGYAFCKWLPYVTGGLAIGDLDLHQHFRGPDIPVIEDANGSETNAGWFIGGGLQYAITEHWSVRAQYQYIDLGDASFGHQFFLPNPTGLEGSSKVGLTEHNASFAIIFGF